MNIGKPVRTQGPSYRQEERAPVIQAQVFLMKNCSFWLHKPKSRIEKELKRERKHLHLKVFFVLDLASNRLLSFMWKKRPCRLLFYLMGFCSTARFSILSARTLTSFWAIPILSLQCISTRSAFSLANFSTSFAALPAIRCHSGTLFRFSWSFYK